MDGELLGRAVLELTTDQRPLDRGLASAERRVAISTAAMQTTLERSSRQAGATLDKQLTPPISRVGSASDDMGRRVEGSLTGVSAKALKARASLEQVHSSLLEISRTMPPAAQLGALSAVRDTRTLAVGRDRGSIVGARGAASPGSRQNPIVVVLEAGKYTGLGALAAAIGQPDSSHQAPSAPPVVNLSGVETKFSDTQYDGLIAALSQPAAGSGGGGGGGGRLPPVAVAPGAGGGGGGGGGGRLPRAPGGDIASLRRLGWGGGIAGMAAGGTAASFAGLGFEHLITTLLGVAGSAASAGVGGGALALGSLGKIAVGGGSDLAVMASTIKDTQTLSKSVEQVEAAHNKATAALDRYNVAVARHGKNSKQATSALSAYHSAEIQATAAQQALNQQMADLGGTAGVKAEMQLAKNADALNKFWDLQTSGARVAATNILQQVLKLGHDFVPLVAGAAQRNLTIVNASLHPLFTWLEGPQGIQIFNDLENRFAHDLPTAVHAFDQGLELLLRIVDIASAHTGGFIVSVDHLLTRLNAMDNAQLGAGIQRYINDFRLWSNVVKLLGEDIFLLFHQDVGTGTSLVQMLDKMLLKLHAYETSARGQAQLRNIFMVHKTEVLGLVHVLGLLGGTFAHIYLAVAPQLVSVMNDAVIPVLKAVAGVISDIASHSHFAALLLGLTLISAKAFGISKTVGALRSLTQWLLGTGPAAKAGMTLAASEAAVATAGGTVPVAGGGGVLRRVGTRAGAGVERGALAAGGAIESGGLAAGGLLARLGMPAAGAGVAVRAGAAGAGLVGAAGAIAPVVSAVIPLVLAGGAGLLILRTMSSSLGLTHAFGTTTTVTPTSQRTSQPGVSSNLPGFLGRAENAVLRTVGGFLGIGGGSTLNVRTLGKFAEYSTAQLQKLIVQMKAADAVKLNGVAVSRSQLLALARAALKTRTDWSRSFNDVWRTINTFKTGAGPVLAALKDRFATNMRLIAHELGTNSNAGRKAVAHNIHMMVSDLDLNMREGRISVHDGMAAIKQALDTGMKHNAISWRTEWTDMFTTVTDLYKAHKINTKTYLSDVRSLTKTGWRHIRSEVQSSLEKQKADLKAKYDDGKLTNRQYHTAIHAAERKANRTEQTDMAAFASHVIDGMVAAGAATAKGADAMFAPNSPLNKALKALGAKPVSIVGVAVAGVAQQIAGAVKGVAGNLFKAGGGLVQIGQPGQAGRDTVPLNVGGTGIMVAPGEQVAVFNRHQIPDANARFADWGGLGGYFANHTKPNYMAAGGIVPRYAGGGQVNAATGVGGSGSVNQSGAYVFPFPKGEAFSWQRIDQGQDLQGPPGGPVLAIAPGIVSQASDRFGGFGPFYPTEQITAGPLTGRGVYYGHTRIVKTGAVQPGDIISYTQQQANTWTAAPAGWLEIGFLPYGSMSAGNAIAPIMHQLAAGHMVSGVGGGGLGGVAPTWTDLKAPGVSGQGVLATIVRAALKKATDAANAYGQKQASMLGGVGGSAVSVGGPVQAQIAAALQSVGFNKVAIAGIMGNIFQESGYNPNDPGGGLFQFTPRKAGDNGPVAEQINLMMSSGGAGILGAMNAQGSPAAAAAYFMTNFERPGIPALGNRIAGANAAFAAGYAGGGMVPRFASGGVAYNVEASAESDGGQGYYNFSPGSRPPSGYSILGITGNSSDGSAGAGKAFGSPWPFPSPLWARRPGQGTGSLLNVQDIGAGDSYQPAIGIYPAAYNLVGANSNWNGRVEIQRQDGKPFSINRSNVHAIAPFHSGASSSSTAGPKAKPKPIIAPPVPIPYEHAGHLVGNRGPLIGPRPHARRGHRGFVEPGRRLPGGLGRLAGQVYQGHNQWATLEQILRRSGNEKLSDAFSILPDPQAFLDGVKDPFTDWVNGLENQYGLIGSILGETDAAGNPHATLLGNNGPPSDLDLLNPKPGNLTGKFAKWPTFKPGSSAYDAESANRMTEVGVLGGKVSSETAAAGILARAIKERKDRQKAITTFLNHQYARRVKLQAQRDRVQQSIRDLTSKDLRKRLAAAVSATDVGKRIADAKGRESDAQTAMDHYQTLIKDEKAKGKLANRAHIADWTRHYGKEKRTRDEEKKIVATQQKAQPTSVSSAMEKIAKNDLGNENTLLGKELAKVGDVLSEFGGSRTKVGTGGLTGTITTDLKTLGDGLKAFQDDIATTVTSTIPGLDLTLRDIASSKLGAGAATDNSQLASLLQEQVTQTKQALAVSQAQYSVLANLPPYVGSYDKTGIVPGALGAPMLATVHGGEIIAKQASGSIADRLEVIVLDGAVDPNKIRVIANGEAVKVTRGMARNAGRPLAGAGGGLLRS